MTSWKKSARLNVTFKKEISHLELERHRVEFEDPLHDMYRTGFENELIPRLSEEDFAKEKSRKYQSLMKTLGNVDDGPLFQGLEIRPLVEIMSCLRKSRGSFDPKINHSEERITLNGKSYQFRSFNGYLEDQLRSLAIREMVKKPIMTALLEAEG